MPEPAAKAVRVQFREPGKGRVDQFRADRQLWIGTQWGPAIPGTHILADVAAEDLASHLRTQQLWNGPALFDRQVRDAQAGVHLIGCHQSIGWAGIDATSAAAT